MNLIKRMYYIALWNANFSQPAPIFIWAWIQKNKIQ